MKLEEFRRDTGELKDLSFDYDLGGRPERRHGALPADDGDQLPLKPRSLYLIDSGAQYADGTTDVTRTIAIGTPTRGDAAALHAGAEGPYRHRHGAVPQGHARARTSTRWRAGRCGRPGSTSTTEPATASAATSRCMKGRSASRGSAPSALEPGMILSNEPGYYREGEYGIRLENLVLVTPLRRSQAARARCWASRR